MTVSVVIPTYNGADKIGVLLNALLKQTTNDFELLVVIDGSTDQTIEVIKPYQQKFKNLRTVVQSNRGRSVVRNRGAAEARGDILVFYDDDMEPAADSVSRHLSFHQQHNGIVGGDQVEFKSPEKTDIQNYKAALTKKWTRIYNDDLTRLDESNFFLTAANFSIHKKLFSELGGFDERLTDAEDFDLACRAMEGGIPLYFDKKNQAIHHDAITASRYVHRLRQYGKAHLRLQALHPHRKKTAPVSSGWKRMVYRSLAFPGLLRLIDRDFLKRIMPERIRYKFYDLVIQAMAIEFPDVSLWPEKK